MRLVVDSLTVRYTTKKTSMKAAENISFHLQQGSTLALVGESGSGKTTVAKAIAGLVACQRGSIVIESEKKTHRLSSSSEWRKNVQIVFQDPDAAFNPKRTIGWHIDEVLALWHPNVSQEEAREKRKKLLTAVELEEDTLVRYAFELSGGQKQRASILRSLLVEPAFLILDEPLASQDASKKKNLLILLKKLQREFSLGYVYITHDLSSLPMIADSVAVMYQGSLVEKGLTHQILSQPTHEYTKKLLNARLLDIRSELVKRRSL